MSTAQDRADVIDTCTRMMWLVDIRDWDSFTEVFADRVTLDYTSIYGGEPWTQTPDEVKAQWSALLGAFDATQHLLGNHLVTVDGDSAVLTAVFQATHLLATTFGSPRWTLGGTYRFGLVRVNGRWLINEVVMTATWADGNKDILTITAGRQ
ncbi:nuclear transport factor 2 family protein [Amycolatopsis thermalba]|uniref:Nuclear transport factor 2 family protein n=1 Tax=Amycolatopsis thermalba TaxID=944492 RepID=A0ABY4NS52_9PSEU|nr:MULTISPECIES: nuclear transport factor 2 family protein [Amycolatopsis]UQS22906.1 nuclear transport factor 2 family protein [Amycolatopsis thermalba]